MQNQVYNEDTLKILKAWSEGDIKVESQLIDLLYPEIHKIAHYQMKSKSANALQTTEIVSEAFIKLQAQKSVDWKSKEHFLAITAKVVRRVIVDQYRSEFSQKRGGAEQHITLESASAFMESKQNPDFQWLEMNDLLNNLNEIDSNAAQVVEYKIFGGMTIPEMAKVMAVSEPTISRNWKFAKTWLLSQMK